MKTKFIAVFCFLPVLIFLTGAVAAERPEFFVQLGHSSTVHSTAFSPDGKIIASGGMDNNVKLWNAETGREMRTLQGHTSYIYHVAFSPDGRYVVSAGNDMTIRVWDPQSGREVRRINKVLGAKYIAFGPGGNLLFGDMLRDITIWNVETGLVKKLSAASGVGEVMAVSYIQQGKYIAAAGKLGFIVVDPQADKEVRRFGIKAKSSYEDIPIVFSADGRYALEAKYNQFILWDTEKGTELRTFEGRMDRVNAVAFSPDGRHVLSGSANYMLKLWKTDTGKEVQSFYHYRRYIYGARYGVTCVAFSPDGKRAVAGYKNGTMKLWDILRQDAVIGGVQTNSAAANAGLAEGDAILSVEGKKIRSWPEFEGAVSSNPGRPLSVALLRDGQEISVRLTAAEVKTRDAQGRETSAGISGAIQGGVCLRTLEGHKHKVSQASLSSDGLRLVAGHEDGTIALWDMQTGRQLLSAAPHQNEVSVAFVPESPLFLTAGDYQVTVRQGEKKDPLATFKHDSLSLVTRALACSPDGRYAAAGGSKSIAIYDLQALEPIRTLPVDAGQIDATFSPDSRILASATKMEVKLWDVATGTNIRAMRHGSFVYAVAFAPGGRHLVSGAQRYSGIGTDYENTIKLWDASTGRELRNFGNYQKSVYDAVFSRDGRMLLTGGDELILWDVGAGSIRQVFSGHHGYIWSVGFLPDGKSMMSAGDDGTVRIWNLETGKEIAQLVSFAGGEWIVITPEGYFNASLNGDRYLNVRVGNNVYGIENYREAFFRPDLVKVALSGGSLDEFRNIADVRQPPSVAIVDTPKTVAKDEVKITLRLQDNGGGIGSIRLYLNKTAVVMDSRAVKLIAKDNRTILKNYTLKLANGRNVIRAVAFNGDNTMQSNDAVHEVIASFASTAKPSMHALIIGINEFKNPKLKLNYPVADAELFAQTLKQASEGLFEKVHIKKLVTREATTSEAIIREIKSFQALRPDDLFVFYIASHGTVDEGEYFLITSNVGSLRTEKLKTDAISQHMLKDAIANIPATKKLIIIDTCNAGALGEAIQVAMLTRGMSEDTALKILSRAVGSTILSASTSLQEALEGYQGHGLFTYVLVEGLKGKADKGKTGYIRTTELADYVDNEVPALAEKVFKRAQYPTISISGQAFPIGKTR